MPPRTPTPVGQEAFQWGKLTMSSREDTWGSPTAPKVKTLRDYATEYQLGDAAGAWMASDPDHGDYDRRKGFRNAGALLLERTSESPIHHHLIYPALAVYRHYYEIQLKELVRITAQVFLEGTPPRLRHDLPSLLTYVERGLEAVWPDEMDELAPVRQSVDFLHGVDPTAQTFRYSTLSRTGAPSIPERSSNRRSSLSSLLPARSSWKAPTPA